MVSRINAGIAVIPHIEVKVPGLLDAAALEVGPQHGAFDHAQLKIYADVAQHLGDQLLGQFEFLAVLGVDH